MGMDKQKTALLVMDYQNDIVHENGKFAPWGIPAHVEKQGAIGNTKNLLEKAREVGLKVIFVKVEFDEGYPELENIKAPMYGAMKQSGAVVKGGWGADFHEDLKPKEGEAIVIKTRINPFTNESLLKELDGFSTLILAGVATNFVVEASARSAADLGFEVIVVEDCCASMNQEMHDFSMKNILPNLAKVDNSENVCKDLRA